jgi:hypothetical protein
VNARRKQADATHGGGSAAQDSAAEVRVGSTVWVFDLNRRQYAKAAPGRLYGPIIWRSHWGPHKIVGETSRSWILDQESGLKVPKRGADPAWVAFSEADIDKQAWLNENRHSIVRHLERVSDYDTLRAVAQLIGYKGE